MDEFYKKVYENNIDTVIKGIPNELVNEVKDGYKEYLKKTYFDVYEDGDDISKLITVFSKVEHDTWIEEEPIVKENMLLKDVNLNKLRDLSAQVDKLAKKRLGDENYQNINTPNLSDTEIKDLENQMAYYAKNVRDFNKGVAESILSESVMDLNFGLNKTDNTSFRNRRNLNEKRR